MWNYWGGPSLLNISSSREMLSWWLESSLLSFNIGWTNQLLRIVALSDSRWWSDIIFLLIFWGNIRIVIHVIRGASMILTGVLNIRPRGLLLFESLNRAFGPKRWGWETSWWVHFPWRSPLRLGSLDLRTMRTIYFLKRESFGIEFFQKLFCAMILHDIFIRPFSFRLSSLRFLSF